MSICLFSCIPSNAFKRYRLAAITFSVGAEASAKTPRFRLAASRVRPWRRSLTVGSASTDYREDRPEGHQVTGEHPLAASTRKYLRFRIFHRSVDLRKGNVSHWLAVQPCDLFAD